MKRFFTTEYWGERDVELFIGKFLRCGVYVSCAITILGGILYMIQQKGMLPNYHPVPKGETFNGVDPELRGISTILSRVMEFDGAAIIQLGVFVLIATPILRVAISAIAFLIEKDYMYVVITLIVLMIILANMFLGFH